MQTVWASCASRRAKPGSGGQALVTFNGAVYDQIVVREVSRLMLVSLAALATSAVLLAVAYFIVVIAMTLLIAPNGIGPDD